MNSKLFSNYKIKKLTAKSIEAGTRPRNFVEFRNIRPEYRYHVYYSKADFKKLLKKYHPMVLLLYKSIMIEAISKTFHGNLYVFDGQQERDLAIICAKYDSSSDYEGLVRFRMIMEHFERSINFDVKDEFTEILIKILSEYVEKFCKEKTLDNFLSQLNQFGAGLKDHAEVVKKLGL